MYHTSLPVEIQPLTSLNTPLLSILNNTIRVLGSRAWNKEQNNINTMLTSDPNLCVTVRAYLFNSCPVRFISIPTSPNFCISKTSTNRSCHRIRHPNFNSSFPSLHHQFISNHISSYNIPQSSPLYKYKTYLNLNPISNSEALTMFHLSRDYEQFRSFFKFKTSYLYK